MEDIEALFGVDTLEDELQSRYPEAFNLLLKDQTTSTKERQQNIFWATKDYECLGEGYKEESPIMPELITGEHGKVIMPRVLKDRATQRARVKSKAEIFTPSWICNAQNNLVDEAWFGRKDVFNHENDDHTWTTKRRKIPFSTAKGKTWRDYVRRTCLEMTCGEAPYLVSRYDAVTGEPIAMKDRIGMLDRKLRVVSENTSNSRNWLKWARTAYESTYGYEWQGDSLFKARENLLVTFMEYYYDKFGKLPVKSPVKFFAYIISWNIWQMDGLKCVVPKSCGVKPTIQKELFPSAVETEPCMGCRTGDMKKHNGKYCYIMNWRAEPEGERVRFVDLIDMSKLTK